MPRTTNALLVLASALGSALFSIPSNAASEAPRAKKSVLVMPLAGAALEASTLHLLDERLLELLGADARYEVLARAEVDALLAHEAAKDQLGCAETETACLAAVSKLAKAALLVTGGVGKVGDSFVLYLTLLDTQAGQVEGRATATVERPDELLKGLEQAVAELLGGGSTAAAKTKFWLPVPARGVKIAVFPLAGDGVEPNVANNLTQIVALELKRFRGFSVISKDEVAAMLQLESAKDQLGCDEATCFAEIGGALGVDYLVIGNIGRLQDTFLVGLKLVDTKQAVVANRVNETFKGRESDLLAAAKFAVYQLVGAKFERPGHLQLRLTPSETRIELDGVRLRENANAAQLPPGKHSLRFDADGFYSRYLETYVEAGATNNLLVELTAMPTPWYQTWWFWTISSAVVLGAAGGLYYTVETERARAGTSGAIDLVVTRGLDPMR